jgi:DNA (cytosine-5)-methyltransferase 1
MRYLSICSGIEAATVAAHPLGWEPAAFAEIEQFPSAVLAHRYPTVPNLGDFTKIEAHHVGAVDLLVGGTPCQAFSVAGKRIGLDDPRGNLTLEFLALAGRLRPRWMVWENVPGVLSIDGGRTFGAILGALGQLGYGFAYRVLDAQHFGVPQRRRRVFVVGCAGGDWQRAAAVLFERAGLCGDSQAGGEARKDVAGYACGGLGGYSEGCGTLRSHGGDLGGGSETLVAHTLRGEGHDASEDGTGRGVPLVAVSLLAKSGTRHNASDETLIAFGWQNSAQQGDSCGNVSPSPDRSKTPAVLASGVRRLTPTECERLQGFPDNYTLVPYRLFCAADGPRYKAIGNSMAVPVMRWIFERIAMVDAA